MRGCAYAACTLLAVEDVDGHGFCEQHLRVAAEEAAPPPTADRAEACVETALALTRAVRRRRGRQVAQILDAADLQALCVVLAAMVPAGADSSLLDWAKPRHLTSVGPARVAPCGTRSGRQRHKRDGETPCEPCDEAERTYQRERHQARRAAQRQQVAS